METEFLRAGCGACGEGRVECAFGFFCDCAVYETRRLCPAAEGRYPGGGGEDMIVAGGL